MSLLSRIDSVALIVGSKIELDVPSSTVGSGNTKNLLCGVGVVYLYPYSLKSSSLKTTHSTPNPPQTAATTPPIHAELGALSGTGAGVGVEVFVAISVATESGIELEIEPKASLFRLRGSFFFWAWAGTEIAKAEAPAKINSSVFRRVILELVMLGSDRGVTILAKI